MPKRSEPVMDIKDDGTVEFKPYNPFIKRSELKWEEDASQKILTALNLYAMGIMGDEDYDYAEHLQGFTNRIIEDLRPIVSYSQEQAREEADKELIEKDLEIEKMYERYRQEIRRLMESQPGRGKPHIRIKDGNDWYIPMITKYFDTPEGIYLEAVLKGTK